MVAARIWVGRFPSGSWGFWSDISCSIGMLFPSNVIVTGWVYSEMDPKSSSLLFFSWGTSSSSEPRIVFEALAKLLLNVLILYEPKKTPKLMIRMTRIRRKVLMKEMNLLRLLMILVIDQFSIRDKDHCRFSNSKPSTSMSRGFSDKFLRSSAMSSMSSWLSCSRIYCWWS